MRTFVSYKLDFNWTFDSSLHGLDIILLQSTGLLLLHEVFLVLSENFINLVQAILRHLHGSLLGCKLIIGSPPTGRAIRLASSASASTRRGIGRMLSHEIIV